MHTRNIISISAAPGWSAVYGNPAEGIDEMAYPLVGWAIEEIKADWATSGEQRIFGLVYMTGDGIVDAEIARSLKGGNFIAYSFQTQQP